MRLCVCVCVCVCVLHAFAAQPDSIISVCIALLTANLFRSVVIVESVCVCVYCMLCVPVGVWYM